MALRIGRFIALVACLIANAAFGASAAAAPTTPDMPYYPQPGILWQDLRRAEARPGRTSTSPRTSTPSGRGAAARVDRSEPYSGPCREGPSGFHDQPSLPSAPYVRDVAISTLPMTGMRNLPHDVGPRTATFVRGTRTVAFRGVQIGAIPASAQQRRIRVVRPNGVAVGGVYGPANGAHVYHGRGVWGTAQRLALRWVGRWKLRVDVDGVVLAEAPLDFVALPGQVRNRRPNPVSASILPAAPARDAVPQCRISTSLVTEDPDYQVIAYRYRWTVGSRVVRTVRSAALSDVLRRGLAAPGQRVVLGHADRRAAIGTPSRRVGRRRGLTGSRSDR